MLGVKAVVVPVGWNARPKGESVCRVDVEPGVPIGIIEFEIDAPDRRRGTSCKHISGWYRGRWNWRVLNRLRCLLVILLGPMWISNRLPKGGARETDWPQPVLSRYC